MTGLWEFFGIGGQIRYLLTEPVHLWYLYAAAALYLSHRRFMFAQNASRKQYHYALILAFFAGFRGDGSAQVGMTPNIGNH